MKFNKQFYSLLFILFALCVFLYLIQSMVLREGLSLDNNEDAVNEAKTFSSDLTYAASSGYIKVLPLNSTVLNSKSIGGIMGSYPNITILPIAQYAVKSSYNSCCSGTSNYISNEMLMYTLSRGCRFIDLEISNIGGKPYVVSPDRTGPVMYDKNKICQLNDILTTAVTYGLSDFNGHAPNHTDPLFVHLRINPDASYNNLYSDIANSIKANMNNVLYNNKININKTTMKDIMGKVIIIIDSNYNPGWKKAAATCTSGAKNCLNLNDIIHLESGSSNVTLTSQFLLTKQANTPIMKGSDGLSVNNINLQIVLPETDVGLLNADKGNSQSNPNFKNLVTNWGCNFITNKFYNRDIPLLEYEKFFNIQQLGIVPLSAVFNYYLSQQ